MWEGRAISIAIGISKAFGGEEKKEDEQNLPPLKPGHKRVGWAGFKDYFKEEIKQQERERIDGSGSK